MVRRVACSKYSGNRTLTEWKQGWTPNSNLRSPLAREACLTLVSSSQEIGLSVQQQNFISFATDAHFKANSADLMIG
jgi:hypothetical protein